MASIRLRSGRLLWPAYARADTLYKKFKGIMLMQPSDFTTPLLFTFNQSATSANAIHSLFCLARFDAVYLDEHKQVVQVFSDVAPWRPWIEPRSAVKYLIECPAGQARALGLKEGDALDW